jgi:hypothetical protein
MSRFRVSISILTLAAVTACPFECLQTKATRVAYLAELRAQMMAGANLVLPPTPPRCQNETGCVCQGAVLIAVPYVDTVDLDRWDQWCLHELAVGAQTLDAGERLPVGDEENWCRPISGRMLRALLGSFLI